MDASCDREFYIVSFGGEESLVAIMVIVTGGPFWNFPYLMIRTELNIHTCIYKTLEGFPSGGSIENRDVIGRRTGT